PAVPIGRPVANAGIYILDRQMEPLCQGMPGEIHLGGIGLARGYISRPDLTAEKFVPSPFSMQAPACLYKTGDLGRYLADGRIEFLGRIDHQVKIRGNRVETGEIEAVMRGHAAVGEAVVMARQSRRGDTDLVAYVLANAAGQLSLDELRDLLRRKLPAYMIPSSFVVLDALPLTSNGKIDRKALHAMDIVRPVPVARRLRPRNQVETAIASIWEAVLKIDQISVTDNFFDLGGHSLAMAQVFGHLRNALRRDIVLTDLFRFPTIRSLAGHLGAEPSETSSFAQKYESAEMKRQAMRRSRRLKRAGETEARREDFQAV
ncbi:MAG TPA: phosphopantetheine-binding protein, partial [Blastocatellia bacterium]|nr:phosphopantetheine-binding protein [Blastocatellia bacterium]